MTTKAGTRRLFALALGVSLLALGAAQAATGEAITIHRDRMGVPHVYAETAPGIFYGAGYALAQDRLVEFELFRAAAAGRSAELTGPSAVAADRKARLWTYTPAQLTAMFGKLTPEFQAIAKAYVAGINQHIDELNAGPAEKRPYEFKEWGIQPTRWTLNDFLQVLAARPSKHVGQELLNLEFYRYLVGRHGPQLAQVIFDDVLPLQDRDALPVIPDGENRARTRPPAPTGMQHQLGMTTGGPLKLSGDIEPNRPPVTGASRCLVIAPSKSASGNVLMMESTADGPDLHLSGGGIEAAGFSTWSFGVPVMGRGKNYGWLLTSGEINDGDMYAERLDPNDRYRYFFRGKWLRMEHRTETIKVKGGEPIEVELATTVHGPVVQWDTKNNVAYTQRLAKRGRELESWVSAVEMARAKNYDEFVQKGIAKAVDAFGACYGGDDGKIAFWETGLIPIRPAGVDPRLPTPGTGEFEWTGFLPMGERPWMENPKQGFIHAWNSKPTSDWMYGDGPRFGKTFRTYLGDRLAREKASISLDDMKQFNRTIGHAIGAQDRTATDPAFFAAYLNEAVKDSTDPELKQAVALMTAWNGLYEAAPTENVYPAAGLPIFRHWLTVANQMIVGGQIDTWSHKIDDALYIRYRTSLLLRVLQGADAGTPVKHDYFPGGSRNALIQATIRKTLDDLRPKFGAGDIAAWRQPVFWKYYDPSLRAADKPTLAAEREKVDGRTAAKLGLSPGMVRENGKEGWAILMEIAPGIRSFEDVTETGGQNMTIGQDKSGNPHLADQVNLHLENGFKTVDMKRENVVRDAETTTRITMPKPAATEARK